MTATNPNPEPLTIREAVRQLDARELSVAELMRDTLRRIQSTDEAVIAWIDVRPTYLLELAEANDRRRQLDRPVTSLFGIPLGIKDIIDVSSYQTVCNMESRDRVDPAGRDAEIVHQIRKSGAIFLGKTMTQEAAAGVFSDPCRNPWDVTRIPGGSSGGSAAAVANGTCLGAIGTDTGGSIRIPASLCGVVGLKPTCGRLSNEGIYPLSPSLDTPGPMANTVADAMALYLAMQGRHKDIPAMWDRFPEGERDLRGRRIGVLTNHFNEHLQPEVAEAMEQATTRLTQQGAEIVRCSWEDAAAARYAAGIISRIECAQVHRDLVRSNPDMMGEQLRKRVEIGAILGADVYFAANAARLRARDSIADLYRQHRLDAIVAPSTPITAPLIGQETITYPDGTSEEVGAALTRFTAPWNATGQPVIAVPAGVDHAGLPIGLSFVGRPDQEFELADIAHAFEQAQG